MVEGKPLSRRSFCKGIARIAVVGPLVHFGLLGGTAFAAQTPACPGGLPADDACTASDPDKCPGETNVGHGGADECPPDGNRAEDLCNTGGPKADICNETASGVAKSDQCESQTSTDDVCDGVNDKEDTCNTGETPEDNCPATGGIAAGDNCFGGGATTNGQVQDTCDPPDSGPEHGDECPAGEHLWGGDEDDCKPGHEDECHIVPLPEDDTCYNGTDSSSGDGGDDWCRGDVWASDTCNDGTDQQDKCIAGTGDGAEDVCPGGAVTVDKCTTVAPASDDYCLDGLPNNDECGSPADADECPGGGPNVDYCPPSGAAPEDECTASGGCAGGDQVGSDPIVDTCTPRSTTPDACTMASPDNPE